MRLISNNEVKDLLGPEECIEALEAAYIELARGRAVNRPRSNIYFPVSSQEHPGYRFRFKSQEGGSAFAGVWALRIASDMVGVETLADGGQLRRLLPAAPGGRFVGFVLLFSVETLEPLAVIQIAKVLVFSPNREHRRAFASETAARTGVDVMEVSEPRQAVVGCDVVVCATTTVDPCVEASWPDPGAHVTSITWPDGTIWRREVSDELLKRAGMVVVLSREQIEIDNQIDPEVLPLTRIAELPTLLAGDRSPFLGGDAVTVFANNTGLGIQFAALGALVLSKA